MTDLLDRPLITAAGTTAGLPTATRGGWRPLKSDLVTVTRQESPVDQYRWLGPLLAAVDHLDGLQAGWDGAHARAVDKATLVEVVRFMASRASARCPAPQLVPTRAGGVQAEWDSGGVVLEIVFEPGVEPTAYVEDSYGDEGFESTLWALDGRVAAAMERLVTT